VKEGKEGGKDGQEGRDRERGRLQTKEREIRRKGCIKKGKEKFEWIVRKCRER
jgi:hypothetical protein